ncbi:MAG: hypothetical protein IJ743_01025 [Bacilli bacterium]|nr:hypothetical protein [Bacilli bacterium]
MRKKEKIMIGIVLISVLMITISMSYAYFTSTFNNVGNRDTSITAAQVGSIRLNAEAATYTSEKQFPGEMTVQKFYIEPVGEGKGIYEIDLTGVINESLFGSDVEISLYKAVTNEEVIVTKGELTQDGDHYYRVDTLNTNGLTPIYTGTLKNGLNILYQEEFEVINESGLKIRKDSSFTAVSRYTYYLVYNYKNNGEQSAQMGTTFSGTISAKLINEKTLTNSHIVTFVITEREGGTDSCYGIIRAYYEDNELASLYRVSCSTLQETEQITSGYDFSGFETTDINSILDAYTLESSYFVNTQNVDTLIDVSDSQVLAQLNSSLIQESLPYQRWENYEFADDYSDIDYDVVLYDLNYSDSGGMLTPHYFELIVVRPAGDSLRLYDARRAVYEGNTWEEYNYVYPSNETVYLTEDTIREQLISDLASCSLYEEPFGEVDYENFDFGTVNNPAFASEPFFPITVDTNDFESFEESSMENATTDHPIRLYCLLSD